MKRHPVEGHPVEGHPVKGHPVHRRPAPRAPVGGVGRAELLRAFAVGGERALASTAELLGFERRPETARQPREAEVGRVAAPRREREVSTPSEPTPPPSSFRPIRYWRPVAVEREEEPADPPTPEDSGDVPALSEDDLRAPAGAESPPAPPLVAWPRLWRCLDDALRTPRPRSEIDVRALVRRWARGELVRELPRRAGLTHARLALVVDRSPRLIPFWDDQRHLVEELARRLGASSMRILRPPSPATAGRPWIAADEVVLALSDLGFYTGAGERGAWLRFGRALREAGARILALVPCPSNRWHAPVAQVWSAIDWGAPTGAALRGAPPFEEELEARCEELLRLVSSAVRVEPGLLRAARRLLPHADAGTEADAWAHPQVDASSWVALSLDPLAARRWQRDFASSELREAMAEILLRWHRPLTRELQAEEAANLLAAGVSETEVGEARVREAVEIFRRLGALLDRHSPRASVLASGAFSFFRRFKNRAPERAWHHPELRRPLARAMAALRRHDAAEPLPVGVTPDLIQRLSEAEARRPSRRWEVRQRGELWVVGEAGQVAGGSLVGTIHAREPRLGLGDGFAAAQELELDEGEMEAKLPEGRFGLTLTGDLERLRFDVFERPPWAVAAGRDRFGLWASFAVGGVEQRMRWIAPGRFWMGSPEGEPGRDSDEGPRHLVVLTEGFWLAGTACTQALWKAVMGENPSRFQSPQRPVEQVSWEDCAEFMTRLNARVPGLEARLPTEAQWEYACRAGTQGGTWLGDLELLGANHAPLLDEIAWYGGNCGVDFELENGVDISTFPKKQYDHKTGGTHEVALKQPNPWGLYDMLGNVLEWCSDWYGPYGETAVVNPTGPDMGTYRVRRGGSWNVMARRVRAASRYWHSPGLRYFHLGFRVSRGQSRGAAGGGAAK